MYGKVYYGFCVATHCFSCWAGCRFSRFFLQTPPRLPKAKFLASSQGGTATNGFFMWTDRERGQRAVCCERHEPTCAVTTALWCVSFSGRTWRERGGSPFDAWAVQTVPSFCTARPGDTLGSLDIERSIANVVLAPKMYSRHWHPAKQRYMSARWPNLRP